MFQKLRNHLADSSVSLKSVTAIFVFGAIILVFVLFGMPMRHSTSGMSYAAIVNTTMISFVDFKNEVSRVEQYAFGGGQFDMSGQRQLLNQIAINNLINSELVSQQAQKAGILATDTEVRDFILNDLTFLKKEGKFQREYYQNFLMATHSTAAAFEDKVRKDRLLLRSRRLVEASLNPLKVEVEKQKELKSQKWNVNFVNLNLKKLDAKTIVSDADAKKALEAADFSKKVEEFYNNNKATYTQEEQVKAQHILIKTEAGKPESEKAALDKIKSIEARLKKEDFGKLAAQFSEDPGSKSKKGDLGFFNRGSMVPEFDKEAFVLPVGKVSAPIKTSYGYHLIKVTDKKAAQTTSLEDAKLEIAKKLTLEQKGEEKIKLIEDLLAKGDQEALNKELASLNVNWEETGFFGMDAEEIPKIASKFAAKSIFEVSSKEPLLKKLVRDGEEKYIIKFKESKIETFAANNPAGAVNNVSMEQQKKERASKVFEQWIDDAKKQSNIETNTRIMENQQ